MKSWFGGQMNERFRAGMRIPVKMNEVPGNRGKLTKKLTNWIWWDTIWQPSARNNELPQEQDVSNYKLE